MPASCPADASIPIVTAIVEVFLWIKIDFRCRGARAEKNLVLDSTPHPALCVSAELVSRK